MTHPIASSMITRLAKDGHLGDAVDRARRYRVAAILAADYHCAYGVEDLSIKSRIDVTLDPEGAHIARLDATQRLVDAHKASGLPMLEWRLLKSVCFLDAALSPAAKELGMSRNWASAHLRTALDALTQHYGSRLMNVSVSAIGA